MSLNGQPNPFFPTWDTSARTMGQYRAPGAVPIGGEAQVAPVNPQAGMTGMAPATSAGTGGNSSNRLGIDDAMMKQFLGTYGDQMELSDLDSQLAQAQALRDSAGPKMRDNGRVSTAANPLEFLGHGIQQYKAGKEAKRIKGERTTIRDRIKDTVGKIGTEALKKDSEAT